MLWVNGYEDRLWPVLHRRVVLRTLAHRHIALQQDYRPVIEGLEPGALVEDEWFKEMSGPSRRIPCARILAQAGALGIGFLRTGPCVPAGPRDLCCSHSPHYSATLAPLSIGFVVLVIHLVDTPPSSAWHPSTRCSLHG